ncbi:MAG: hypothetical protein QM669_04655 [Siphonobacter sp.]
MKYIFSFALVYLLGSSVFAQTGQGERFNAFSGSFSYNDSKNTGSSEYNSSLANVNVSYQRGTFSKDNLAQGWYAGIGFSYSGYYYQPSQKYHTSTPSITGGYLVRKYLTASNRVRLFVQGQAGISYSPGFYKDPNSLNNQTTHAISLGGNIGIGAAYFYKKNWALEATTTLASLGYQQNRYLGSISNSQITASAGLSFNTLQVGIAHYFGANALNETMPSLYAAGRRYIAGDFSGSYLFYPANTDFKTSSYSLGVSTAKFVNPNLANGIGVSGGYGSTKVTGIITNQQWNIAIRPYWEYYLAIANKWSFFINAGIQGQYGYSKVTSSNSTLFTREFSFLANIRPGIQYQITPKWAIAGLVGSLNLLSFSHDSEKSQSGSIEISKANSTAASIMPSYTFSNLSLSLRYFMGE